MSGEEPPPPSPLRRAPSYDPTGRTTCRPSTAQPFSQTFPLPTVASGGTGRPSTAMTHSQRHKRLWAHDVTRSKAPAWATSSPRGGGGGLPSTYRPISSDRYGNLEESTGKPSVRSELVSRPSSGRTPRPPASDMATRGTVTSADMEIKQATMHFRPTLPFQVTWDADQDKELVRHVGVQCASTSWTRFFHSVGQNTNTSLKKGNPFYQYFDVYLDPDPLGPIHVLGKDSEARLAASPDDPPGEKVTREEMTDFFRRSHERLYFVTGTEPEDLFVDIHHLGNDAKEAWPAMGKAREHERLNLAEYTRYVSRLQPRSGDDMKQLMRLQSGLLRHMTDEIANSEREVAERVKAIEARLKASFNEKADRLEAALAAERSKNATLQKTLESSQKAISGLESELEELKASTSKTIAELRAALERTREQLAEALQSEDKLRTTIDEMSAKSKEEIALLEEEIAKLSNKLKASELQLTNVTMQLKGLRTECLSMKDDLMRGAGVSTIARQGNIPAMECYLPVSSNIQTVAIPKAEANSDVMMIDVTVPSDTALLLPPGTPDIDAIKTSDGLVLAKRLPEPSEEGVELPKGWVKRSIPCGTSIRLPPGFSADDEFEDEGFSAHLPAGSVVVVPVTLKPSSGDAADKDDGAPETEAPASAQPLYRRQPRSSTTSMVSETDEIVSGIMAEVLDDVAGSGSNSPRSSASSEVALAQAGSGLAAAKALKVSKYRLRKASLPGGSIVVLPKFVHEGVNRYAIRAQSSCMVTVSQLEIMGKSLLNEREPEDSKKLLSAKALAGRFSEKPDANGTVKLDLKPGTVLVTTDPDKMSEIMLPEGSTIVLGAGGSAIFQPKFSGPGVDTSELERQIKELQGQVFPLELLRIRVKKLLERQAQNADGASVAAASTAVLTELLKVEPRRMKGQVYALDDPEKAPSGGLISIEKTSYSALESSGEIVVTLKRSGGGEGRAGVLISTVDGGAMAESDYKPLKDFEVVWDDGDVEDRHLSIGLVDDDFHEGDEHFYLVITDPHPECGAEFAIGMNDACSILIIDDDNPDDAVTGMPLAWARVTTNGVMPWDATGFPRQLTIPDALSSKAWKNSAQKAEKSMKPERLKALTRNFIQAKRNADRVDDRNGSIREGYSEFYKFYMDYNFSATRAPAKSAVMLRSLRHIYRKQSDPLVCMVVALIGWYDPAPAAFGDLFTKMISLMSNDLVACSHSPHKFWTRLSLDLKMSVKEVKVIISDMFKGNEGATDTFKIENKDKEIQEVVAAGQAIAGEEVDLHISEAELKSMPADEVPRIPVIKFIILAMQHFIVRLRRFVPALEKLLEEHSEMNEDTEALMMNWEQYQKAWDAINPNYNERSKAKLYERICQMQMGKGSDQKARKSTNTGPRKSSVSRANNHKSSSSKISVRTELVLKAISNNVDFLFCSTWT